MLLCVGLSENRLAPKSSSCRSIVFPVQMTSNVSMLHFRQAKYIFKCNMLIWELSKREVPKNAWLNMETQKIPLEMVGLGNTITI